MKLLDRTMRDCAFVTSTDWDICGKPTVTNKSSAAYCDEHYKKCYAKPRRTGMGIAQMDFSIKRTHKPSGTK